MWAGLLRRMASATLVCTRGRPGGLRGRGQGFGWFAAHLLVQSPALHYQDTGNEFQLSWATGAPQKESPLGPGLHPPVNWSRPSTRRGRGLPWMSVRHIFLMRFRSFGRRRRRAPSEGSRAP